jgi:hypothetical protein
MPKVAELQAASIYVYADDHNPPHFNVRGPDSDANFRYYGANATSGLAGPALPSESAELLRPGDPKPNRRSTANDPNLEVDALLKVAAPTKMIFFPLKSNE